MLAVPAEVFAPTMPGLFAGQPSAEAVRLLSVMSADTRARSIRTELTVMAEADQRDLLPKIEVPTLLLWGELDARSPVETVARQFLEAVPRATLVVLPGVGHLSNIEAPEPFNRTVREFCRAHS
jgi:pimeloyl-ACP methyl ester carboxylesterase